MTSWRLRNGHHLEHLTFHFHLRLLTATFQSRAVTRELPNKYPFIVQRGYIIDTVSKWNDPTKTLFDFTVKKLKEATSSVVYTHFERYAHGNLKQRVLRVEHYCGGSAW